MADSGIILNVDFDSLPPITPKVVFKGGQWRDRKQAERDYKRKLQRRQEDSDGASETTAQQSDPSGRPSKRPRTGGDDRAQQRWQSASPATAGRPPGPSAAAAPAGRPQNGITSRLFTSNPTPVTEFDAGTANTDAKPDAEPLKPSNAPLSDEASTFLALGLSRRIARQLSEFMAMKAPTSIQKNAVSQLVAHDHDAFLQAETGSGKTLAYLLPIVQRLLALSEDNDGGRRLTKVSRASGLFAVILAPTRELCVQISTVLDKLLGCASWLHATTVVGGENKKAEKARLRKGVNILVATPGRLTDHLDHTDVLDVSRVRWLVLDEGDRLMEMGFEKDIRAIVSKIRGGRGKGSEAHLTTKDGQAIPKGTLPSRQVTVLCSATMKMNAVKLGEMTLQDAVHIKASPEADSKGSNGTTGGEAAAGADAAAQSHPAAAGTAAGDGATAFSAPAQLQQTYAIVPAKLRLVTLVALLRSVFARKDTVMKAIVFLSCADSVDFHFALLRLFGDDGRPAVQPEAQPAANSASHSASVEPSATVGPAAYITSPASRTVMLHKLHGSLEQPVRKATLAAFRSETNPALLITTDIASRGLDVPDVDLVIEYDPAMAVDDHLHRIGRTARAGRAGKTTLFVQPGSEEGYIGFLRSASASQLAPQLYDAVLKKGFAQPVDLPKAFTSAGGGDGAREDTAPGARAVPPEHDPSQPHLSWTRRAEALQLHIEQRLLTSAAAAVAAAAATGHGRDGGRQYGAQKKGGKGHGSKGAQKSTSTTTTATTTTTNQNLLDAARLAFRSHIRAYATHTHEERVFFDLTRLHLGHMAKSFGLREAPGHMGRGSVHRRTKHASASSNKAAAGSLAGAKSKSKSRSKGDDSDGDDMGASAADDAATRRRMQDRMREMMSNPAAEFNIG